MSSHKIFSLKKLRHIPTWMLWLAALIIKLYAKTFRIHVIDKENYRRGNGKLPVIFTIWHNRLFFLPPLCTKELFQKCTVLVSKSRDGEYISSLLRYFSLNTTRGSSSKGAVNALLDLSEAIEKGLSPVITLDGPRGPRYTPHLGAAMLAIQHNIPVIPVAANAKHYWQLTSWDKLQIPLPFTKIELIFGEPLVIPPGTQREEAQQLLQNAMSAIHNS